MDICKKPKPFRLVFNIASMFLKRYERDQMPQQHKQFCLQVWALFLLQTG